MVDPEGRPPPRRRVWWRRWLRRLFWATVAAVLLLAGAHQTVLWSASGRVFTVAEAPAREVILVLGASVRRGGRPSPMLAERLRAAWELYRDGKAEKILVSGDHGDRDYDEVRPMALALEAHGVAAEDIFLDHSGFRTLDSVVRAREVFGVESMIVVSNPFHVARAVFLGSWAGIDTVGVGADYGVEYSTSTRWRHEAREVLARILAFGDAYLLGTRPKVLGPEIELRGDGRRTRNPR